MKRGFTLIELLVVISIISILASIVMVSMSGARDKARDARLKGDLSQVRTLAVLIEDDNNSFALTCASSSSLGAPGTNYATQLATIQGDIEGQGSTTTCYATTGSYCISVELLSIGMPTSDNYCVDSDGIAGATATACVGSATGCNGQAL